VETDGTGVGVKVRGLSLTYDFSSHPAQRMILFKSAFVKAQWSGDKGNSTYQWEKANAEAT
jgi:hypothetical protein